MGWREGHYEGDGSALLVILSLSSTRPVIYDDVPRDRRTTATRRPSSSSTRSRCPATVASSPGAAYGRAGP